MSQLIINGVVVATPKSFKVDISDVDGETNRTARGTVIRDRVAIKRKIDCEWGMLTQDQASVLLQAVSDVFFTMTYPDPQLGITTKTFYVGDRSVPAYSWTNLQKPWSGLSMNFIER